MKRFFLILIAMILIVVPVSYAEEFDTNIVRKGDTPSGNTSNLYKYWAYYKTTGTRYVLRVYDWNSGKYIAVPKEYYINHVYGYKSNGKINTNKQIMYLGVDKTANGKYTVVKSGSTIFTDNTYSHVIKWFDNSEVNKFGLTKNDVNLLAEIIKEQAVKNGNTALAKNMQDVINGVVPYDVRSEILFLMKIPGTKGTKRTGWVTGKGSMENYSFTFYDNASTSDNSSTWRKEYITYLEAKAIGYKLGDDCGNTMKATWLDMVACALYERDYEYVFVNGNYQCSCDLYRRRFGSNVSYWLSSKKIHINQTAYHPDDDSDRWYMYYTPGRCGIPISISNTTYYLTPGKTYSNVNGKSMTIERKIKYSDTNKGIESHAYDYLNIVSNDATKATIYEGWDYITNKMAATLVIACDKDTGNIITLDGITYSEFKNVGAGTYNKKAWDINGYKYLGYITKNDFTLPNVPIGISDTEENVNINITSAEAQTGVKKQVVFVYEKSEEESKDKEAKISIYEFKDDNNFIMYTGKYIIAESNNIGITLKDKNGNSKYTLNEAYNVEMGYKINTNVLEALLGINDSNYEYMGNLIKSHEEYFLTYQGEDLNTNSGDIYNLKDIGENKVHIILGYKLKEVPPPEEEIPVGNPELKISYIDEEGNSIPGKSSIITKEEINKNIESKAEDLKESKYMYFGYTYIDSENSFSDISMPITIMGSGDIVSTTFDNAKDRRHIAFVYRKIKLEFAIDIIMENNDLPNQYIGQVMNEDYWVLDEAGKVKLKIDVSGEEGLNISNYLVKLKIPFDTYMNGYYTKGSSINNLTVTNLDEILVAEKLIVPVWVEEKEYDITATIEATVDGFGTISSNSKDNVEVVGRLYDFTVTNIDGSDRTGDEKWKGTLFADENMEYKANAIPIGQSTNQPTKYNYGIKLGTTFYFNVNTKGAKNNSILLTPKFLYVPKDASTVKEVDVYFNDSGSMKNIFDETQSTKTLKLKDDNILKKNVQLEIERALEINKILDRYKYPVNQSRNIGNLAKVNISKFLSLPDINYVEEFKSYYGADALDSSLITENALLTYTSHWYCKYIVPASSKIVDKGASSNSSGYDDGYLIVCFKIISLDEDGNEYLTYDLPENMTQWQRENLNQLVSLPNINKNDMDKNIMLDTIDEGYAPVIIYQVGVSVKDNNESIGTH